MHGTRRDVDKDHEACSKHTLCGRGSKQPQPNTDTYPYSTGWQYDQVRSISNGWLKCRNGGLTLPQIFKNARCGAKLKQNNVFLLTDLFYIDIYCQYDKDVLYEVGAVVSPVRQLTNCQFGKMRR
jgi:hypothetical protein